MAHKVIFSVPWRTLELDRADVEFRVHRNGQRLGTLEVSKGSVVWKRANKQRGHKVSWKELSEFITRKGKRE